MGNKSNTENFPFEKYFDNNGHRLTVPRKAIIEILNDNSECRYTAEEIYFNVHNEYSGIGLTTVYRTVDLLTSWGLLHRFDFGDGKARYQLIDSNKNGHHHHLICSKCKKVIDYSDFLPEEIELLNNIEQKLMDKYDFDIQNHFIQFQGSCDECRD